MNDLDELLDATTSIEWLILADAAEVVGGKLYLMGGGWDRLTVNSQHSCQEEPRSRARASCPVARDEQTARLSN